MKSKGHIVIMCMLAGLLVAASSLLLEKNSQIRKLETENLLLLDRLSIRGSTSQQVTITKRAPKSIERYIYEAAGQGDVTKLKELLNEYPEHVNSTPGNNHATPLHNAAVNGQIAAVMELISHKANVDAQNDLGFTPLFDAISKGNEDIVLLLIDAKADVTLRNKADQTAMRYALESKQPGLAEVLQKFGAKE